MNKEEFKRVAEQLDDAWAEMKVIMDEMDKIANSIANSSDALRELVVKAERVDDKIKWSARWENDSDFQEIDERLNNLIDELNK